MWQLITRVTANSANCSWLANCAARALDLELTHQETVGVYTACTGALDPDRLRASWLAMLTSVVITATQYIEIIMSKLLSIHIMFTILVKFFHIAPLSRHITATHSSIDLHSCICRQSHSSINLIH